MIQPIVGSHFKYGIKMNNYINLVNEIYATGVDRPDRTGTGTRALFGRFLRFDLFKGFPAVTTKKLAFKSMVSELLWFIEGSGDEGRLKEILYGSRHTDKSTIWSDNATSDYWINKARFSGDLGRVYGQQWRFWQTPLDNSTFLKRLKNLFKKKQVKTTDQLIDLVNGLKNDPYGRRHILSAWNPGELDQMALPPCHMLAQFFVAEGKLSCQMYQRSVDTFLGLPFNIASYSLLTHMLAQVCGLDVGEFIWVGGDCHIYQNHFDQVVEQAGRETLQLPTLWLNPEITDITKFTMDDIKMMNYQSHSPIKAKMAV